jgi:DASS family divalent anion:Na+ symporter
MSAYVPVPTSEEEEPENTLHRSRNWIQIHKEKISIATCIITTIVLWNLKIDTSQSAIQTFAIFVGVMMALMITSIPISVVTAFGLTVMVLFQTLECETRSKLTIECTRCGQTINGIFYDCDGFADGFKTALGGYSQPIVWMIVCAFHLGKAVQKTKLGERVSLIMIRFMGKTILGLGIAIFLSEFILAPFIPSNTARGGGILLPIVMSLIDSLGSTPHLNQQVGRFLILCGAHSNLLISSLFITGAAPNPIVALLAKQILGVEFTFTKWFVGAIIPGIISGIVLVYIISLEKPEYDSILIMDRAEQRMQALGRLSMNEIKLLGILGISLVLWTTSSITHLSESLVAYLAFVSVLGTGILDWSDVITNDQAWDTYFWLSGMILMAEQLSKLGFAKYFGTLCATLVQSLTSQPTIALILFGVCYFFSMYLFSSITGHTVALCGSFMAASMTVQAPPFQTTCLLAYYSSLSACLTSFSTGSVALYFSQGFFEQREWFRIGLMVGIVYLCIYSTIGMTWWHLLF